MRISLVKVSPGFERAYKKLPKVVKEAAKEKERFFRENAFDSRLHTHKLHGKDKGAWAFSINNAYRIKFVFLNGASALFLDVGTHGIYS
ncbi:MAG: type II toxin-antitoxin system mRNA interferase toxin, RelE/StbE family [Candidatus Liptonbacteria bacterium]|nr:type II toxin-antitoxin system mRNA interferase toxin, RelE/StbE family [Candidatus Liptonbacteria bacterium]